MLLQFKKKDAIITKRKGAVCGKLKGNGDRYGAPPRICPWAYLPILSKKTDGEAACKLCFDSAVKMPIIDYPGDERTLSALAEGIRYQGAKNISGFKLRKEKIWQ